MTKFSHKYFYCKDSALWGGEIISRSAIERTILISNQFKSVNSLPRIFIDCRQSGAEFCMVNCLSSWHRERSPTELGPISVSAEARTTHCIIMCFARLELHWTVGSSQWVWEKYPICGHIYFRSFISITSISKNESLTLTQGFHGWKENLVLTFTHSCSRHFGLLD